jgi:hypothetical protein
MEVNLNTGPGSSVDFGLQSCVRQKSQVVDNQQIVVLQKLLGKDRQRLVILKSEFHGLIWNQVTQISN